MWRCQLEHLLCWITLKSITHSIFTSHFLLAITIVFLERVIFLNSYSAMELPQSYQGLDAITLLSEALATRNPPAELYGISDLTLVDFKPFASFCMYVQ
jgi:hypothetical protein